MTFIQGLLWFIVKFVFIGAVAFGGILCGKKLRANKDAKNNVIGNDTTDKTSESQNNDVKE